MIKHLYAIQRDFTGPGEGYGAGVVSGGIAGGLIGGLGGIYDTYQSNKTARENTDKTIAAQKAEAELAYQRQVAMWHMQNAYNSPAEQMKRFGAAGLNPHLIYSQGNPGNNSSIPNYQPPPMQHRYAAPAYGAAISSVLPTLMSVGTWMQNMRLAENKIQSSDQLVEFLQEKYPHLIREFDQKEAMWPYQRDQQESGMYNMRASVANALEEFRHKHGRELDVGAPYHTQGPGGGMRMFERMLKEQQARKTGLEADWLSPMRVFGMVNGMLGKFLMPGRSISNVSRAKGAASKGAPKGNPKYNSTDFWRKVGVYKR